MKNRRYFREETNLNAAEFALLRMIAGQLGLSKSAALMMPLLFTLVVAMLPVLIIVYSLVINLRNFVNWLVDAALGVGDE